MKTKYNSLQQPMPMSSYFINMGIQYLFIHSGDLLVEEKKKFWQTAKDIEGFGQLFVVSKNQKLEWADVFFTKTFPSYARNPHLFPNIPQPFRFYILFKLHICLLTSMLSSLIVKNKYLFKFYYV